MTHWSTCCQEVCTQLQKYHFITIFENTPRTPLHCKNKLVISTSGNHTPGSRFYSDLLDTLADSVCIHQLVLKCRFNYAVLIPVSGTVAMYHCQNRFVALTTP